VLKTSAVLKPKKLLKNSEGRDGAGQETFITPLG